MSSSDPHRPAPVVYVVDDDDAMRESVSYLLKTVGLEVESFATAQAFLDRFDPERPGCLLTDVRMPGLSGLNLLSELRARVTDFPVIVMTAYADVPMAVQAMQGGAADFIEKPFRDQELLDRIQDVLQNQATHQSDGLKRREIEARLERLTPREREVLDSIVQGMLNKQIASELGLSIKTVELHRARVMEKMEAAHLADLVRQMTLYEIT